MLADLAARKWKKRYLLQLFFEQVTNLRLDVSVETSDEKKQNAIQITYEDHDNIVARESFAVPIYSDARAH